MNIRLIFNRELLKSIEKTWKPNTLKFSLRFRKAVMSKAGKLIN